MSDGLDLAVILAGGGGTRLWPWTGPDLPKPLLPLGGGGRTLLAATLDRLSGLLAPEAIRIQAAPQLGERLLRGEPRLSAASIWTEPSPRDTAPAIALAMQRIAASDPQAVVAILPADHRIADEGAFRERLREAAALARQGWLVTLGIQPDQPSTRFGYIVPGERLPASPQAARRVKRFVEKPDPDRAAELLGQKALWNAGMFIWQAQVFAAALSRWAPEVAQPVGAYAAGAGEAAWERAARTSIDYALMERAKDVAVVPLAAGWDDVGGWEAVLRLAQIGDAGPVQVRPCLGTAASETMLLEVGETASARRGVVLGEGAWFVVHGPQGILVAPRARIDEVKRFV